MPGPVPKPTNMKLLHGESRPSRVNYNEPKPGQGPVDAPEYLSESARQIWEKKAPDLIKQRVLQPWDVEAFAEWCEAFVSAREAQQQLDEDGEVIDIPVHDRGGKVVAYRQVINPWWKVRQEASANMMKWGARFGLTPSDRSRIRLDSPRNSGHKGEDLMSG